MLSIRSLTRTQGGTLIIDKSPAFRDGDNLAAINGTPVSSFSGMAKLVKDLKSGDVVELTLERSGETITLPVTLGGTAEELPIEEGVVSVTISKNTDSADSQRSILAGILEGSQ